MFLQSVKNKTVQSKQLPAIQPSSALPPDHSRVWSPRVTCDIMSMIQALSVPAALLVVGMLFVATANILPFNREELVKFAFLSLTSYLFIIKFYRTHIKYWTTSCGSEIANKVLTLSLALLISSAVFPLSRLLTFEGLFSLFLIWLLSGALLTGLIILSRQILKDKINTGALSRRVAVYGSGEIANRLYEYLEHDNTDLHRFVALYDERCALERTDNTLALKGGLQKLLADGRAGQFDKVIITLPQAAANRIQQLVEKLEELPVDIEVCTHLTDHIISRPRHRLEVKELGPVGLLKVKHRPIGEWGIWAKKVEDYTIALLALPFALPLFALIAAAIKLDSEGPVFFRQKRHGLNAREIEVLKFRTMHIDAQDQQDVKQASRHDPRVTRVGRFLRRTSLDELPQLINVLRGEMSIVGPRPHALSHNIEYGKRLELYANRNQVKPGLTGWAQVHGYRGETKNLEDMEDRIKYDLLYIDNWSLMLDLKIILMTPFYALMSDKAY